MASENETVADIVKCIRQVAHNAAVANEGTKEHWRPAAFLATVADRIEAAHKREVEARLRNVTVRADNSAVIAELQRRLKVAEEALFLSTNAMETIIQFLFAVPAWQDELRKRVKANNNALAAIREEKGESK